MSATEVLTGTWGGGGFEKYIAVKPLEPFINKELVLERLVPFRLPEVEGLEKAVKGLPHDLMIEVCQGFVAALQASFNPDNPARWLSLALRNRPVVERDLLPSTCATPRTAGRP